MEPRFINPKTIEAPVKEELAPTARMWERISGAGAAPANLPIAEEIADLSALTPSNVPSLRSTVPTTHTFEEKMKEVFKEGQQSTEEISPEKPSLVLTSVVPDEVAQTPTISTPPTPTSSLRTTPPPPYHSDPYREPIE